MDWAAIGSVDVHYRVRDVATGALIDSSYGEPSMARPYAASCTAKPLPVRIRRKFVAQAIERAVMTLQVGQSARVECGHEEAAQLIQLATTARDMDLADHRRSHQTNGDDSDNHDGHSHTSLITGCGCGAEAAERFRRDADLMALMDKPLLLEVELVRTYEHGTYERELWEYTHDERPDEARRQKVQGNTAFAAKQWAKARDHYEFALGHIETIKAASLSSISGNAGAPSITPDMIQLERDCLLNIAACALKQDQPTEAIRLCTQVLDRSPHDIKARFRRAQAYGVTDFYLDEAERDFRICLDATQQTLPRDQCLVDTMSQELVAILQRRKRLDQRNGQLLSRMFK